MTNPQRLKEAIEASYVGVEAAQFPVNPLIAALAQTELDHSDRNHELYHNRLVDIRKWARSIGSLMAGVSFWSVLLFVPRTLGVWGAVLLWLFLIGVVLLAIALWTYNPLCDTCYRAYRRWAIGRSGASVTDKTANALATYLKRYPRLKGLAMRWMVEQNGVLMERQAKALVAAGKNIENKEEALRKENYGLEVLEKSLGMVSEAQSALRAQHLEKTFQPSTLEGSKPRL